MSEATRCDEYEFSPSGPMHVHVHEHVQQQEPAPTLSFDLTADDDDAATDVELGQDDDELRKANAAAHPPPDAPIAPSLTLRNPAGGVGVYPPCGDAPPWVHDISAGIIGLHNKVDLSRTELAQYGAEIQAQGVRVSHLEAVAHEHTQQILEAQKQIQYYDARMREFDRLQDFEKRLADLEAAKRSLTPLGTRIGDHHPLEVLVVPQPKAGMKKGILTLSLAAGQTQKG